MLTPELRCPACGDEITAQLEYTARYSDFRELAGYECDNYACDAHWDEWGRVTQASGLDAVTSS